MAYKEKPMHSLWTYAQWQAIVQTGQHILVSAAAGSGKTAVLVERMIQRVLDTDSPVDIHKILVVTFTNEAAKEMKKRIGLALEQSLKNNTTSKHLRKQQALFNRASISTLHAFCFNLVRRYYYELNIDPQVRLVDTTEAELLREEVIEALFEQSYAEEGNEHFLSLVDMFGSDRSDLQVQRLLLRLYDFSRSHPFPAYWLDEMLKHYHQSDQNESLWTSSLLKETKRLLQSCLIWIEQANALCHLPTGPMPYAEAFIEDRAMLEGLLKAAEDHWDGLQKSFSRLSFVRLKSCKKDEVDPDLQEQAKELRDRVKKSLQEIKQLYFSRSLTHYLQEMEDVYPVLEALITLTKRFSGAFDDLKQQKCVIDFNDLEHLALKLLNQREDAQAGQLLPSSIARSLREDFVEIMIDEYQDTNQVQEAIVQLLAKPTQETGNLFMVGDVKQSIYRFRLAEPDLFLYKYHHFTAMEELKEAPSGSQAAGLRIDLASNFRSREEVLQGTNYIFKQIMDQEIGEIVYDERAALQYGADYPKGSYPIELHIIDRSDHASSTSNHDADEAQQRDEDTQQEGEVAAENELPLAVVELESRWLARQIKILLGHEKGECYQVYDPKQDLRRPIMLRDMVILLRSASVWSATMLDIFKEEGIPAYADLDKGYFDATEVTIMLSLLSVIDNPEQDIPLAAVLRAQLVGCTEEELACIKLAEPKGSFYQALRRFILVHQQHGQESGSSKLVNPLELETMLALLDKLKLFTERLKRWRLEARQQAVADLIWAIYQETGFYDFVGGLPGGFQRQANLRALYDRARQYEATSFRGLFRFLRFVERMQQQGLDLGTARALGEQEDVVRVMTIHKSKGLEFPVVFVAGLGKRFNMMDKQQPFLLDKDLGFGCKYINTHKRVSYPMLSWLAIQNKIHLETLAEEMRILYVAMTRAKEKLYLLGSVSSLDKSLSEWQTACIKKRWQLSDYHRVKASSYLDWIGPSIIRHRDIKQLFNPSEHRSEDDIESDIKKDINNDSEIEQHPSVWHFSAIKPAELLMSETNRTKLKPDWLEKVKHLEAVPIISEHSEWIQGRLSYQYPYEESTKRLIKQSVTEIKRQRSWYEDPQSREQALGPISDRPRFIQQAKLSAAEKGTAMHTVMQLIPFERTADVAAVNSFVHSLIESEHLTQEEAAAIDFDAICAFFQSELGQMLMQAKHVRREVPFTVALAPFELYPDWKEHNQEEAIFIQGVIDCLIEVPEGLCIIDYKTDSIQGRFPHGFEQARPVMQKRYKLQLDLYARALEHIYQQPVIEKYLYFFDGGHIILLGDDKSDTQDDKS